MKSFPVGLSMLARNNTLIYASPARRIFWFLGLHMPTTVRPGQLPS